MKAIKGLVLFMGILLVAGLGLLGYGLFTQTGKGSAKKPAPAAASAGASFGQVEVPLPAGARIDQALVAGERIVLRITGSGPERLLVLDPATGEVSGSFLLAPQPPAR